MTVYPFQTRFHGRIGQQNNSLERLQIDSRQKGIYLCSLSNFYKLFASQIAHIRDSYINGYVRELVQSKTNRKEKARGYFIS